MIYPEIPKTKFRSTYIAGGIFAFLIGIIAVGLFLPGLLKNCLGMNAPWDWNSVGINGDMLQAISYLYINTLFPVILIFSVGASFFIGKAKSSVFMKFAMLSFFVALLVRYIPIVSFPDSIKQIIEIVFGVAGLAFMVLGFVFLLKGEGKTQAYHANSFHIFTVVFFFVFVLFDIIYNKISLGSNFEANYAYYFPACLYGLFGIVGGIWMLVLMRRDPLEFGGDLSKFNKEKEDKKLAKEQAKQAKLAEKQAMLEAKKNEKAQNEQPVSEQEQAPVQQPQEEPVQEPVSAPQPQPEPTSTPEPAPQPQQAPRPTLPPLQVGPDGVKYRLITQKLPNGKIVQLRIDEKGRPLPPLPQKPDGQ